MINARSSRDHGGNLTPLLFGYRFHMLIVVDGKAHRTK